ncbi:putative Xaa-Pro aminopeptidase [Paramyrothecium foliicola]|nr:putative Xaa-Pro aminopeptidase [Paramyrothecium foliicola]
MTVFIPGPTVPKERVPCLLAIRVLACWAPARPLASVIRDDLFSSSWVAIRGIGEATSVYLCCHQVRLRPFTVTPPRPKTQDQRPKTQSSQRRRGRRIGFPDAEDAARLWLHFSSDDNLFFFFFFFFFSLPASWSFAPRASSRNLTLTSSSTPRDTRSLDSAAESPSPCDCDCTATRCVVTPASHPPTDSIRRTTTNTEPQSSSIPDNRLFFARNDFEAVLKGKYPAKAHAERVVQLIREKAPDATGVLYLEARMTKLLEDNDSPEHFRQRRYFYYLTGCNLADCYFTYDIKTSKSTLFIPPIDDDDVIWSGLPVSREEALERYDVDDVKFTTDVNPTLAHLGAENPKSTVFAIANQVSDSISFLNFGTTDLDVLKTSIEVSRAIKDEYEVALIRKANYISGLAHRRILEKAKAAKTENELEAAFIEVCVANGAKEMAYHPIFASGTSAATLHYVANDAPLQNKQLLLLDAGAEWNNYAADITRTFPLSGKFTKESREIYDIVYKMQQDCTAILKEGVNWDDVHVLAHKIAIDGLLRLGILKGDKDEILENRTSVAFFPHGLGHYLGMDTHDTGGNPNYSDKDKMFRYLRKRGTLPAGSVITVEPGVYFCKFIIDPYLEDPKHNKYIDASVLAKYWDVGGVRIEDNILITKTGSENLTTAPKEPSEVEALISGN